MKAFKPCLLCLCLLLLTSCAFGSATGGKESPPFPEGAFLEARPMESDTIPLVFAISRDASPTLREAAEFFCDQLEEITQGRVTITLLDSIAPDADLITGRAQLAFLNKKRQLAFSAPLVATASPFLYSGYQSFTMRANAPSTLSLLERSLRESDDLIPLAAFYQGTLHLLTDFPAGGYQPFEGSLIALREDADMQATITRLNGSYLAADTDQERFRLFAEGEVTGAEISLERLEAFTDELSRPSYLTLSSHSIIPVWLVASAELYDSLTSAQQAEVSELCATLTNRIDDLVVEQEALWLEELGGNDLTLITECSNLRNRVFNTLPELEETAIPQQWAARDLINRMRRIS